MEKGKDSVLKSEKGRKEEVPREEKQTLLSQRDLGWMKRSIKVTYLGRWAGFRRRKHTTVTETQTKTCEASTWACPQAAGLDQNTSWLSWVELWPHLRIGAWWSFSQACVLVRQTPPWSCFYTMSTLPYLWYCQWWQQYRRSQTNP